MLKKILITFLLLFSVQVSFGANSDELNINFFYRFNDENLSGYIEEALNNNHDLKRAESIVKQYREQVKYSFGNELPSFGVSANYLGIKVPQLDNFELKKNAFILPFIVNYEADFLLKNRDRTKSVKKSYEAALLDKKALYISLLSDVATVYVNILQYDELIKQQEEIVKLKNDIFQRNKQKYERGVIDSTILNTAEQDFTKSKNELENLYKQRAVLLMQLAVLTGKSPVCTGDLQRITMPEFEYSETIPDTVESDVIFSRPDVRAAEIKLEKAKIDVRIARKEFLPTFNITGVWAFNTIAPGSFFSWESSLAAIIAGASQDIFTGGKKIANLRYQKAKYEELFEEYRQTDLEAVKEVNTSLCFIKHDTEIEQSTLLNLNSEKKNFENLQKKYNRGTVSYPEYAQAQIRLAGAEKDFIRAKTQRLVNYFTLYKAVGGQL